MRKQLLHALGLGALGALALYLAFAVGASHQAYQDRLAESRAAKIGALQEKYCRDLLYTPNDREVLRVQGRMVFQGDVRWVHVPSLSKEGAIAHTGADLVDSMVIGKMPWPNVSFEGAGDRPLTVLFFQNSHFPGSSDVYPPYLFKLIENLGYRPANAQELLAFAATDTGSGLPFEFVPLLALGTSPKKRDPKDRDLPFMAPYMVRDGNGKLKIGIRSFVGETGGGFSNWSEAFQLLVVRR